MTLIHFCHCQLTVVANRLLLTGDKDCNIFDAEPETYPCLMNQCQYHIIFKIACLFLTIKSGCFHYKFRMPYLIKHPDPEPIAEKSVVEEPVGQEE
jgi:hypothetical protein